MIIGVLTAQARHLAALPTALIKPGDLFATGAGLIASAAALPGEDGLREQGLDQLKEATGTLRPDGGLPCRRPSALADALAQLITARNALRVLGVEPPAFLTQATAAIAPAMRCLMHGDGTFAVFNGGDTEQPARLSAVLSAAAVREPVPTSLDATGFERLAAGNTVVIADTGEVSYGNRRHYAGPLSFEMSSGRRKLIVNCGSHPDETTEWSRVLGSTAAHSTLSINDTDAQIDFRSKRRPMPMAAHRSDGQGSQLIQLSHDRYREEFGIVHNRDLYLSESGDDFRGKDQLVGGAGVFTIRFHLHPDISASLLEGGQAVLLRAGKSEGWRFRAQGAELGLEESVYLGHPAKPRRSQQIVLRGESAGADAAVRWSFLREGKSS